TLQEALLLSLEEKLIDDEEFAVLYEEFTPQNLYTGPSTWYKKPYFWGVGPWTIPFRHWDYEKFSFENKDPAECKADFRFEKSDISLLVDVLQTPDTFTCPNGTVCDSTEGLCVILKRFSYPCRLSDMISTFGRSVPELSVISNEVTEWM
ncbi:unnamed protein product, partial [Porites evermanni]